MKGNDAHPALGTVTPKEHSESVFFFFLIVDLYAIDLTVYTLLGWSRVMQKWTDYEKLETKSHFSPRCWDLTKAWTQIPWVWGPGRHCMELQCSLFNSRSRAGALFPSCLCFKKKSKDYITGMLYKNSPGNAGWQRTLKGNTYFFPLSL